MTILIPLFFISFVAIVVMFNKKLSLMQNIKMDIIEKEQIPLEIPYVIEIKHLTIRKVKRYGYVGLVIVIRLYFRSVNLWKRNYSKLKTKIENWHKNDIMNNSEKQEVNRFLRIISDYKHKIRKIKHDIKEEEEKITPP